MCAHKLSLANAFYGDMHSDVATLQMNHNKPMNGQLPAKAVLSVAAGSAPATHQTYVLLISGKW
jgi:hypothetical protein